MSYAIQVKKDHPLAFWPMDNLSSSNCVDISGCLNNGSYNGSFQQNILPVCQGVLKSTKITSLTSVSLNTNKNFYQLESNQSFATKNSSDNSFSIEAWIYPNISYSGITSLVSDSENNIGIFYDNGNILFKLNSQNIFYSLPTKQFVYHIVAVYNLSYMYLYVNKKLVAQKKLNNFLFTNTTLSMQVGPTEASGDYFLINNLAIYRHALTQDKVKLHYDLAQPISTLQISKPEGGEIFEFYDNNISAAYSYSYPANKSWSYFLNDSLYYNEEENYIELLQGTGISKSITIEDFITIPSGRHLNDSKIEWSGENGISVYTSLDGITYDECNNGKSIPQYKIGTDNFDTSLNLYIKIIMSTTNDSKYLPRLSFLILSFYSNQVIYAQNGPSKVSSIQDEVLITDPQINLSSQRYSILSRDIKNGIRFQAGSGFYLNTSLRIKTIEFFYRPITLGQGSLFNTSPILNIDGGVYNQSSFDDNFNGGPPQSSQTIFIEGLTFEDGYPGAKYNWGSNGAIDSNNINLIYVNGINKTSQTNINNVFIENELHHVIMVLNEPISKKIYFGYKSGSTNSSSYQNLSLFDKDFSSTECADRYISYMGANNIIASDSSFSLTENDPEVYNIDWKVLQSV
jgi:hypothetical protein